MGNPSPLLERLHFNRWRNPPPDSTAAIGLALSKIIDYIT